MEGHASSIPAENPEQTVVPLQRTYLNHECWKFRQVGYDAAEWMPVSQFPTNLHLDLFRNSIIPDPYIAKNEKDVQWVGEKSWCYKTSLKFKRPLFSGQTAVIVLEGLDTHARVLLNGKTILQTDDMFIPWRIDVTKHLRSLAENALEIIFESTYLIGKKLVVDDSKHKYGCWNGGVFLFLLSPNRPVPAPKNYLRSFVASLHD